VAGAGAWVGVAAAPQADKSILVNTRTLKRTNRVFFILRFLLY
jgi:hypothetical protein